MLCLLDKFSPAPPAGDLYAPLPARNPQLLFAVGTFEHFVLCVVNHALVAVASGSVSVRVFILLSEGTSESVEDLSLRAEELIVLVTALVYILRKYPEITQNKARQTDIKRRFPGKYGTEDHQEQRDIHQKSPQIVKSVSPVHKSGETIPKSHP